MSNGGIPARPGQVGTAGLAVALAGRDDAALAGLLTRRPDLATPAPSSITALAARAASRPSVERVLAGLDGTELAVAEAVVALAPVRDVTGEALTAATGAAAGGVLDRLTDLGLVVDGAPVTGLVEALGPHPAGLGPTLRELRTDGASGSDGATGPGAVAQPAGAAPPTTAEDLAAALDGAPPSAVAVLDALTWGPPVGTVGRTGPPEGAAWLLERGILRRLSPTQLVLPREVALAARGGRTRRDPAGPPELTGRAVPAPVVAAEGARAAEEIVRLVTVLLRTWHGEAASVLRAGGVGVRELRRTAATLEVDEPAAAFVAELAAMAGLLTQDGDEHVVWAPSRAATDWLTAPLPLRWAHLAGAWARSARTPWLVGTRGDDGALRSALQPTLERAWAAPLRLRVLAVLAAVPRGRAASAEEVHAALVWERPRATAPEGTVVALLRETDRLGISGAGALTTAGRLLEGGADAEDVAAAMEADLPETVGEILVQGDLTAVVPGRPEPDLAALLEACSEVESRGAALTVRFTPTSVRRALDAGTGAAELLDALAGRSRTPLPQALEYLVRDTARRHGQVRVGTVGSYLRLEDEAIGAILRSTPGLEELSLRQVAPTVLVSPAPAGEVVETLRTAGLAPVLEGPDGAAVVGAGGIPLPGQVAPGGRATGTGRAPHRARRHGRPPGLPTYPGTLGGTQSRTPGARELAGVVARMRSGEERARRDAERRAGSAMPATDPVHALALLREAAADGQSVEIVIIGATGQPERRTVRPLSVDGGRVRLVDVARESELTVAVHRISAVSALPV